MVTVLALLCTVSDCAYCPHGSVRETEERKKGRTEGRERRLEEGQKQEKKGWGEDGRENNGDRERLRERKWYPCCLNAP